MRRTSALIPILNALMAPSLRGRRDADAVFWRLFDRAGAEAGDHAPLEAADVDGYRTLLGAFARAPGLTPLGWAMARSDIKARMVNQWRVQTLYEAHPGIRDEVIAAPIVIMGLPRTGTTVTHRVIAQSEGHRAPMLWELMHTSLALPDAERARRVRQVEAAMTLIARLAPAMRAIHPQNATAPDEDPFALPHGAQHLARASMPGYEDWCYERDYTADYDYLKRVYQVLQHGRAPARWVIKSPTHLANVDQIFRVFPDARVLWLHRDPHTVMGSICSLVETSQRLHVRRPDLHEIGRMCLRQLPWMIQRARAARPFLPRGQIVEVSYHQLFADPHTVLPRIYEALGASWTETDRHRLEAVLARPSRRVHEYDLARYGVTSTQIEDAFGDYTDIEARLRPLR